MNRTDILLEANNLINGDREKDYGTPQQNFGTISAFWQEYIAARFGIALPIEPWDVAMMMDLLKTARAANGQLKPDTFIDKSGYSALAGELSFAGEPE